MERSSPRIWAVGSGKGGVGKSVISTSMAIALAESGRRCVLVDADLGGANLHTLLGIPMPRRSLTDLILKQVDHLSEVLCETSVPGLRLASGSQALLEAANPKHHQKEKILRHLQKLDAEHVIVDLGAGAAFNTLDFWVTADEALLVVVPEPTSVENAYYFLKAAYYRRLRRAGKGSRMRTAIASAMDLRVDRGIRSPRDLVRSVSEVDPEAGEALAEAAAGFTPWVVINKARSPRDRQIGAGMRDACRDYFGTDVHWLGAVDRDELVPATVGMRRPVLQTYPDSVFARGVRALTRRLLAGQEATDGR